MSTQEATAVIRKSIEDTLREYTKGTLDTQVHVIDISYTSLLASNKRNNSNKYSSNYTEFLVEVRNSANIVQDYLEAVTLVNNNKGTCVFEEAGSILLISKNFGTARDFITSISNKLKENDDFGLAFRSRNYEDIQTSRSLYRAAGSQFLISGASGYSVYRVEKLPNSTKYGLVLVSGFENIKEVSYLAQRRSADYVKTTSLTQFNNTEVDINATDNSVIIKKRLLSVLDLGHGQGVLAAQATPLGLKLSNLLTLGLSPKGQTLVNKYITELVKLHNVVDFEFKNTSTNTKASGYIVLSIQHFKRNNTLSIAESAILNKLRKNIAKLLPSIPGSNTIIQDALEIAKNKVIAILTKKPIKNIRKHAPTTGKASPKIRVVAANTSSISVSRPVTTVTTQALRTTSGQFYSLTGLQSLINTHLQDVISANMGSGSSSNILNYRTGRFASTVKVEQMSQSREGMITAFYSYMKNPYATFSDGGRQSVPKTRDPKLLIAKSIREIAATKVGNRMRSVSV